MAKTIEGASNNNTSSRHENVQVAFLQVEQEDVERDKEVEKKLVDEALKRANNNQTIAAQMLGLTRSALNKRLNRHPK